MGEVVEESYQRKNREKRSHEHILYHRENKKIKLLSQNLLLHI